MAFRRKRSSWDDFLLRNSALVAACGVPDEVISNELRFLIFLNHGFDEWGRATNRHSYFHPKILTDDQLTALADLLSLFDEGYRVAIESRWTRSGS